MFDIEQDREPSLRLMDPDRCNKNAAGCAAYCAAQSAASQMSILPGHQAEICFDDVLTQENPFFIIRYDQVAVKVRFPFCQEPAFMGCDIGDIF